MWSMRIGAMGFAAATLAASGCGNSGSSASPSLSKADFIARADAVCRRANTMRHTVTIRIGAFEQDYVHLLPPLVAYQRSALTELTNLTPPASMASDWKQILANVQTLINNAEKTVEYARSNNLKGLSNLNAPNNTASTRILTVAGHDGFHDCAQTAF